MPRKHHHRKHTPQQPLFEFQNAQSAAETADDELWSTTRRQQKANSAAITKPFHDLRETESEDRAELEIDELLARAQLSRKTSMDGIAARLKQERRVEAEAKHRGASRFLDHTRALDHTRITRLEEEERKSLHQQMQRDNPQLDKNTTYIIRTQEMLTRNTLGDYEIRDRLILQAKIEKQCANAKSSENALNGMAKLFKQPKSKTVSTTRAPFNPVFESSASMANLSRESTKKPTESDFVVVNKGVFAKTKQSEKPEEKPATTSWFSWKPW